MMFTVVFHHVTQQSENTLRMYFGLNFAHRRERTHRKVAPTRKREKRKKREDFSPVLNLPGTCNCKLCYIERALSITDQVRGFILWKISNERTRVWFHCSTRHCASRHCAMPKGKRKNRSTDVSNISNNSSVGNTTLNTSKKPRVNAESSKQSTLSGFVEPAAVASGGIGNKTFTANSDGNNSEDSVSLKEHLSKMESLLNDKLGKLDGKIGASGSNLSAQITIQFDSLRSDIFSLQQEHDRLKTKVSETEDAIDELECEVEKLRKTVERERELRNDLEQYQRRDSLRFLGVGSDRGRETTKDCEEKVLAIINEDLGLNHILATDISIAYRVGMRENRPRPIIVKFLSRKHKTQVIQKRGLLKWSGRDIVEDLTPTNMKRLKSVQQHPEVKNSWTKEGMIHALLQNGKIVKITEGNLKIIDEAATGNAPVPDIEMSEVLAPLANAERRTRLQQQQTRNASLAASTPKQDSIFRSTHPSVPIRRKTSQAGNSDN